MKVACEQQCNRFLFCLESKFREPGHITPVVRAASSPLDIVGEPRDAGSSSWPALTEGDGLTSTTRSLTNSPRISSVVGKIAGFFFVFLYGY